MTADLAKPSWQCVLVCWGSKYSVATMNRLIDSIRTQARGAPRMVVITDVERPGLAPDVDVRIFPPFFLQPHLCGGGCQAKLAMFEPDVLQDDLPAIYVDLDTVVLGDLGAGIALMRDRRSILILKSVVVPFGALSRAVHRLSGGRMYARGNSSIVIFHPAECGFITERFRALHALHPGLDFRPMVADERFISWIAQARMIVVPRQFATKLSAEFMSRFRPILYLRAALPWVRRRRAGLAAVTLSGPAVKSEILLALPDGAEVTDAKGRVLIWSDRAMGPVRRRIIRHYSGVQ